jgi:hypothetical protein
VNFIPMSLSSTSLIRLPAQPGSSLSFLRGAFHCLNHWTCPGNPQLLETFLKVLCLCFLSELTRILEKCPQFCGFIAFSFS